MKKLTAIITACACLFSAGGMIGQGMPASAGEPMDGWHGDNITWSYDGESTLTISGTGEMQDRGYGSFPWAMGLGTIETVIIEEGITSLAHGMLDELEGVKLVIVPESVTEIGSYAFGYVELPTIEPSRVEDGMLIVNSVLYSGEDCTGDVVIPDSIVSISPAAFGSNENITSVTIPDSVEKIGGGAFWGCSGLTSVTLGDGVRAVGSGAFSDTPWLEGLKAENPLVIINSMLIDASDCTGDVIIPEGITSIPDYMFDWNKEITSVILPDTVTYVGNSAFSGCSALKSVYLPDSVTYLGSYAFFQCSALESVRIPSKVSFIGLETFESCESLTELIISEGVSEIGLYAFCDCNALESVELPKSVSYVSDAAFGWCDNLTSVTIKNPDCEFDPDAYTQIFSNDSEDNSTITLYGYDGSTAQAYAEKEGYTFVSLGAVPEEIMGDINRDGVFDVADVILLQKWLLGIDGVSLTDWQNADFDADGVLNIFDLGLMKRALLA